jgi:hypothetical protein
MTKTDTKLATTSETAHAAADEGCPMGLASMDADTNAVDPEACIDQDAAACKVSTHGQSH